jgi:hypothetical protein
MFDPLMAQKIGKERQLDLASLSLSSMSRFPF